MIHLESGSHASDGALVALLDGESEGQPRGLQEHVSSCAVCSERSERLRRQGVAVSSALATLDEADPHAGVALRDELRRAQVRTSLRRRGLWRRTGLRAAAGVLIVAGVAAATPLGRIAVRYVEAALESGSAGESRNPEAPAGAPSAAGTGTLVAFEPTGGRLIVRFSAHQPEGDVELSPGPIGSRVRAQVMADPEVEELVLLPGELRVVNSATSRAGYRVTTPQGLRVLVLVGGDILYEGVPSAPHRLRLQR